jgi:tetratricopeptide (TPR) repeat protein
MIIKHSRRYTMQRRIQVITLFFMALVLVLAGNDFATGQIVSGQAAPDFSLKDTQGKPHDLGAMSAHPMIVLYFFDAESRSSQEGLLSLDNLAKRFADTNLTVWGITTSTRKTAEEFIDRVQPTFPVLLDATIVSDLYDAKRILPTVAVVGNGLKIIDYFQGGGKTTEIMLVRLAERTLQWKQNLIALAISDAVIKKNPKNLKAKTVKGYAEMKAGNLAEAEEIFQAVSRNDGQGEVLGKEGLSVVYAQKGETDKAFKLAEEVEKKAPERSYPHVVKANILYSRNKKAQAEAEYRMAVEKKEGETYQKATALNQFGRFYASIGKLDQARELYDQAVAVSPYYVEATSNKGMTYEKEGNWGEALASYRQALSLDETDNIATVLAQKAQQMLDIQKDTGKRKEIDALVKDLAERFRKQKQNISKSEDTWTSRPMVLTFLDLQEQGGLSERDGLSTVLSTQLAAQLNNSGRLKVVERVVLDRLLEELNLGSSELADPETALKLGRVLAAKVIGTGSLLQLPAGSLLSMRLIDTETSAIPKVITRELGMGPTLVKEVHHLTRIILKAIIQTYPLQGFLARVSDDQVMINLGKNQGVVLGTQFEVIEEQAPVEYKGKKLQSAPKSVAKIEIVSVEPDLSFARILNKVRALKQDDKVVEKSAI